MQKVRKCYKWGIYNEYAKIKYFKKERSKAAYNMPVLKYGHDTCVDGYKKGYEPIKLHSNYYSLTIKGKLIRKSRIKIHKKFPEISEHLIFFEHITRLARKICNSKRRLDSISDFFEMMDEIILMPYYGCVKNRKCFYGIINRIITRSPYGECIFLGDLIYKVQIDKYPILHSITCSEQKKYVLINVIIWVLNKIVKPLIKVFFRPIEISGKYNYIPRHHYEKFQAKVINYYFKEGYLEKISDDCVYTLGKLVIKAKNGLKDYKHARPILKQIPIKSIREKLKCKEIVKYLYVKSKAICPFVKTEHMANLWLNYVNKTRGKILYGCTIDLEDAFGCVNIDVLLEALDNHLRFRPQYLNKLKAIILNQRITIKGSNLQKEKNIFLWKHGLLQGQTFASALFSLYVSYLDQIHLKIFDNENSFLHRTTDDYFFCCTDLKLVYNFIAVMQQVYKINKGKTKVVFSCNGGQLKYAGSIYDLKNRHVKFYRTFPKNYPLYRLYRYWNIKYCYNRYEFLRRRTEYSSNLHYFGALYLNLKVNDVRTVHENYFNAMVLLAFRFDSVLKCIYHAEIFDDECIGHYMGALITEYANIISNRLFKNTFRKAMHLLLIIGFNAFLLVINKRSEFYKNIIEEIDSRLGLFGVEQDDYFKQFTKLPECFRNIRINRRCKVKDELI